MGSQPLPDVPPSGYLRHVQGFSPSARLHGFPCVPGLFHPGPAHGVSPFRAFSLCRAATPLGVRCPPDVCLTSLAPNRSPTGLDDDFLAGRSPASCDARGQALQAPTRADHATLASRDLPRRLLAEPLPWCPRPCGPRTRGAGRRTASGSPSGPFSLQRARSPRPVVRPVPRPLPSWAFPLQGSLALAEGRPFLVAHPLSGFHDDVHGRTTDSPPAPQGLFGAVPGRSSCEARQPS